MGSLMMSLSMKSLVRKSCTSPAFLGPPMLSMRMPVLALDEREEVVDTWRHRGGLAGREKNNCEVTVPKPKGSMILKSGMQNLANPSIWHL